jgi:adenosine deaminase
MLRDEFLRSIPKVELHCHIEGSVRAATFADQAKKHGVALPKDEVDELYDYETIYEFLVIFGMVSSTLIDQDDFARVAYEAMEDGHRLGNLRYREMFFNPTLHTRRGVPMKTVVDGLADGLNAAEADFGVKGRLIADVYRQDDPAVSRQMVEELLSCLRPEVIGLGMDAAEAPDPPERFVDAFHAAKAGGLRLTSHASEDAPPVNITTCLDLLGCERIDHGYHILSDPAVIQRCLDDDIHFTVCPTSTAVVYGWPDLSTHPIIGMVDAGLKCMLNSDDPTMFHTDIGKEYVDMVPAAGWGLATVRELVLNGVDATWLDDGDKAAMAAEFAAEFDRLAESLEPGELPA